MTTTVEPSDNCCRRKVNWCGRSASGFLSITKFSSLRSAGIGFPAVAGHASSAMDSLEASLSQVFQLCVPFTSSAGEAGAHEVRLHPPNDSSICFIKSVCVKVMGNFLRYLTTTPKSASMSSWVCPTGKKDTVAFAKCPSATSHAKKPKTVWFLLSLLVLSSWTCKSSAHICLSSCSLISVLQMCLYSCLPSEGLYACCDAL